MKNITTLEDVVVYGGFPWITTMDGEVIDLPKNFQYYRNVITEKKQNEIPDFKSLDTSNLQVVQQECCFMMGQYHIYPYGHLYDVIQYCKDYQEAGLSDLAWLVGNTNTNHTQNIFKNHFKTFGCKTTIPIKRNEIKIFKKLHISHHETFPAQFDPQKTQWIKESYLNQFRDQINEINLSLPKKYNLYLHRPSRRKVLNFDEIKPILEENNFLIIDGSEGLISHISYFQNPNLVMGPHGSLFRNALFSCSNNKSKYYEWCADNRVDYSIKQACIDCGISFYEQFFTKGNDNHEIEIPIESIEEIIKNENS